MEKSSEKFVYCSRSLPRNKARSYNDINMNVSRPSPEMSRHTQMAFNHVPCSPRLLAKNQHLQFTVHHEPKNMQHTIETKIKRHAPPLPPKRSQSSKSLSNFRPISFDQPRSSQQYTNSTWWPDPTRPIKLENRSTPPHRSSPVVANHNLYGENVAQTRNELGYPVAQVRGMVTRLATAKPKPHAHSKSQHSLLLMSTEAPNECSRLAYQDNVASQCNRPIMYKRSHSSYSMGSHSEGYNIPTLGLSHLQTSNQINQQYQMMDQFKERDLTEAQFNMTDTTDASYIPRPSGKPELYPERRALLATMIKPRTQMALTCYEILYKAPILQKLVEHKLDILEQSLQLYQRNLGAMCDLAVSTPPCDKIDTTLCICHKNFSWATLGDGIWKYFCDRDKCRICTDLFDELADRSISSRFQLTLSDLNLDLIKSTAVTLTNYVNKEIAVVINGNNPLWYELAEDMSDLTDLLLFLISTIQQKDTIGVILDVRRSETSDITRFLMDSLSKTQSCTRGGISQVQIVTEDQQTGEPNKLTRPVTKSISLQLEFLSAQDCKNKFSPDSVPDLIGGNYIFNSEHWIVSQSRLERRIQRHQQALGDFLGATHDISLVPRTIRHASKVITNQSKALENLDTIAPQPEISTDQKRTKEEIAQDLQAKLLEDHEVGKLLQNFAKFMNGTDAYKQMMESLTTLCQTERQVSRLKDLAEERLNQLYGCQKIWFCMEEITKTLTLLRRAHDLINSRRIVSSNLKSAQVQHRNLSAILPSVKKLFNEGRSLLTESQSVISTVSVPIPWLQQLTTKLGTELDFLESLLWKTEELVNDTFQCYITLDKAYDWAVESMKFVSSMSMNQCLTEEGVQKLSANLETFMADHPVIDPKLFDEVSEKARNLNNKKLVDQCRIAKSRCEETKQVLRVRRVTIVKAREEIEAHKARKLTLEQLSENTNITPLTTSMTTSVTRENDEDLWLPQTPVHNDKSARCSPSRTNSTEHERNNNSSKTTQVQSPEVSAAKYGHNSSSEQMTESTDTIMSSQEDIPTPDSSTSSHHEVSPIVNDHQKEASLVKRRSFGGFAQSLSVPCLTDMKPGKQIAEEKVKRLSNGTSTDVSEQDEGTSMLDDDLASEPKSFGEQIRDLVEAENVTTLEGGNRKRISLITGSSESLESLKEDHDTNTEDSGTVLNACSSTHSAPGTQSYPWSPIPVNSHLMNKRGVPVQWQSMSDLRLTEAEVRSRRTLAHIMDELIQTEQDYCVAMKLVVENYIPETERDDLPQSLRGKRGVIFGNIEKIFEFHTRKFLERLQECEKDPFKVGKAFLQHEKDFLAYAYYNKNKPKSDQLMGEHGTLFFRELQLLMGDKMNLSSYLLKPVQRMGKYALILKQIIKECPDNAQDKDDLLSAEEMVKYCLQHGNDLLAMDSLQQCDVNLQEQGRLLLQDEFTVSRNKGSKITLRQIFLFEDLLVFAKPKKIGAGTDQYIYKSSIKTADIGMTENVGTSGTKFELWFRKRNREVWTLTATKMGVKNKWVKVIEKLLWNQAIKNREHKINEFVSMGIGNKPSLDLARSEDNINDRQVINVNLSTRDEQLVSASSSEEIYAQVWRV